MSNIAEKLELRRRKEVVTPTGLKVGYHLPDIAELIVKVGQIPTPAVDAIRERKGEALSEEEAIQILEADPQVASQGMDYIYLVVAAMLDDIDGDAIQPDDDRTRIVAALESEDREYLFQIGTREKEPDQGEA